ncbi:hypothetical protein [Microbacterium candidum]|uniref:DUF4190 domain-containing protein n=1 Tax=Microbacterium candidum TaxID=3041922 RepID=A0ABT7MY41_9MICO|nr:hypothetical protein [Microbacterium sp. ASV49]MDL9979369.1 hypothetical protein [Microbacterium sp. ASV49]
MDASTSPEGPSPYGPGSSPFVAPGSPLPDASPDVPSAGPPLGGVALTPPPTPPEPVRGGRALLTVTIVSAAIGLVASVVSVALTDIDLSIGVASPFVPWLALAACAVAVVCGAVLLERRARRRGLIGSVVGVAAATGILAATSLIPLPDLAVHAYGYACPFSTSGLQGSAGWSPDAPIPYGSTIAESSGMQNQPWTTFTVDKPVDVTAIALTAGARLPRSGTYFAVPVTRGKVDESAMSCSDPLKAQAFWASGGGRGGETADIALALPDYPGGAQGGRDNGDGTVTYFVIFDITPDAAAHGAFGITQLPSNNADPSEVYWGAHSSGPVLAAPEASPSAPAATPAPSDTGGPSTPVPVGPAPDPSASTSVDVYVPDDSATGSSPSHPLPYGSAQTMKAVRTGKDALTFIVGAPKDITAAAKAGGAAAPKQGAYLAVPVTSREIDASAITDANGVEYPGGYWSTPANLNGVESIDVSIPGYPTLTKVQNPNADGTWSYWEIFDVPASTISTGRYEIDLTLPDGTVEPWYWGTPAP